MGDVVRFKLARARATGTAGIGGAIALILVTLIQWAFPGVSPMPEEVVAAITTLIVWLIQVLFPGKEEPPIIEKRAA